jgi:hypothetical protein
MRTLHVDLSVPEGCTPEDAAKLRRVWTTHADKCHRDRDDWRIVFDAADADGGSIDAVISIHVTSWVHWNALFAFLEKGGSGSGLGGLHVSTTATTTDSHIKIPSISYDGGDKGLRMGFDEGDACDPWDVFAVHASNDVSLSAALIHSAMYVRQPHVSLPELAGEALPFFDNPQALFEQ